MSLIRSAALRDALLRRPLVTAALAAFAAALLASGYLSRKEAALLRVAEPVPVVMASRDIAAGETVDDTMLLAGTVPRRFLQGGAIAGIASALGRIAMVPIRAGTQLTVALARLPYDVGALSAHVPLGKSAVSLGLPNADAAGGLLRPGDAVDVIATFDFSSGGEAGRTALTVVRRAPVLAVGRRIASAPEDGEENAKDHALFRAPPRPGSDAVLVTIAVTPAEAQEVSLAKSSAYVSLALRARDEPEEPAEIAPATLSTIARGREGLMPFRKKFREYRGR